MAKAVDNISKAAAKAPARMSKKDSLTKEQLRAVDAAAADHDEVTRRELVPLALDAVPRSPREQEDDLVKRVVVVGNLRPIAVGEVEEAEILPQIPPLFVLLWLHESTSCIVGGSIIA